MQRVLNTMQFLWVLGQATVDGLTRWLCTFTKHHRTMSDVLRAERYLLTQELLRVSATRAKPPHTSSRPRPYLLSTCGTELGQSQRPESFSYSLQGGEVHRGVLDQLYVSEDETTLSGLVETRDGPSTASRLVQGLGSGVSRGPHFCMSPGGAIGTQHCSQLLLVLPVPVLRPSLCNVSSHSGLGAEEPLSSRTDDTSSPLSTGYNTRSGSEEIVSDTGDLQAGASLHGSQELLANARTRMRTASELLLDRWDGLGCVQVFKGILLSRKLGGRSRVREAGSG